MSCAKPSAAYSVSFTRLRCRRSWNPPMPARPDARSAIDAGSGVTVTGSFVETVPPVLPPVDGAMPPVVEPVVPGSSGVNGDSGLFGALLLARSSDEPPLTAAINTPNPTAAPPAMAYAGTPPLSSSSSDRVRLLLAATLRSDPPDTARANSELLVPSGPKRPIETSSGDQSFRPALPGSAAAAVPELTARATSAAVNVDQLFIGRHLAVRGGT